MKRLRRWARNLLHALHGPVRVQVLLQKDVCYGEVLRSGAEVDRAIGILGREHPTRPKTWDLFKAAHYVLEKAPDRSARILDAGCVGSPILEVLHANGYRSLHGCDLSEDRLPRVPGFSFTRCDLTSTPYEAGFFDAVVCLSVIEHGVPVDRFLAETARILKRGVRLVVSTDYHEPKIATEDVSRDRTVGLPWMIFSRSEIEALIAEAGRHGFVLDQPVRWEMESPSVLWWGKAYTFLFLALRKP